MQPDEFAAAVAAALPAFPAAMQSLHDWPVGIAGTAYGHPLAEYLCTKYNLPLHCISVSAATIEYHASWGGPVVAEATPGPLVLAFLHALDERYPQCVVEGRHCLAVLRTVAARLRAEEALA